MPKLSAANTAAEVMTAAAHFVHYERHTKSAPADIIPTLNDLCRHFDELAPNKIAESGTLWSQTGRAGPWVVCCMEFTATSAVDRPLSWSIYGRRGFFLEDMMAMHNRWLQLDKRTRHPVVPLLEAWFNRPPEVSLDAHKRGILGAPLAKLETATDYRNRRATLSGLGQRAGGPAHLPLLDEPGQSKKVPILCHVLHELDWHALKSRAAPTSARLLVEGLMASPREARIGTPRLEIAGPDGGPLIIGALVEWLAWNRGNYRPSGASTGRALRRAMGIVNGIEIALPTDDRPWPNCPAFYPLQFEAREGLRWTDRVRLMQTLPRGSEVGPAVDRAVLRQLGTTSKYGYFLYLALCFEWNRIAYRGKWLHLTKPERRQISRKPFETGRRIPNKAAMSRYGKWEPSDLLDAIFPFGLPDHRRKHWCDHAIKAVLEIERICGCEIVRSGKQSHGNPHGFPWQIVPFGHA